MTIDLAADTAVDDANVRRGFSRRDAAGLRDSHSHSGAENESNESRADSEDHELDEIASDAGSEADEETGLNTKDRKKFLRKKRLRNDLAARIGGDDNDKLSKDASRRADKVVLRELLFNAFLILLWYIFSVSISMYNTWMFSSGNLDFPFPLFTTSFHMIVQFILASIVLILIPSTRPRPPLSSDGNISPRPLMTPFFYFTRLVPCGATTSLDIGLGNTSLRYITLTFYTMCKSSVLGFVLLFAFVFRLETPSWKLISIIATMSVGVLMMVAGETSFNATGFALVITASLLSGFRWALTQILLLRHPATSNPFATIFFLAPIMFLTLFIVACFSEGPIQLYNAFEGLNATQGSFKAVALLLFPGGLAFCMISSEFTLLQRTNVVTLSICGIFKEVVTIAAAGIRFHDKLTPVNITGLIITIGGIATYNYLKVTKMRQEARERTAGGGTRNEMTIDERSSEIESEHLVQGNELPDDDPDRTTSESHPPERGRESSISTEGN